MLRTSSYTIYVDLPGNQEEMLLVHGYTGSHDVVSRQVATYIRSLENKNPPKPLYGDWQPEPKIQGEVISPSDNSLKILEQRGYLTEMSLEEEENFLVKMANKLHHLQSLLMPSYILMPTYSCNLRCSYCFQDHMRTDPAYGHLLRTMQPEMIDRIFGSMAQIEALHGVPKDADLPRDITLFGGEPLLESSYSTINYIIEKAKSMGRASFSAVSNGTELHAYQKLLNPENISSLQITLDGTPDEHDQRRIYADGSGSFEKIAHNITMALDLGVWVNVRMNIDRENVKRLPELANEIEVRGWSKYENFSAYTAPVHAANNKTDIKSTFSSWDLDLAIDELRKNFSNMSVIGRPDDWMVGKARKIFDNQNNPFPSYRASYCGAHNKMYVLDAFGDIYACWEKTGDEKVRIGHITEQSEVVFNEELTKTWRSRTMVSNPVCRKCRYAFSCGGGCAVLAMNHKGKYLTNYCDGFANRFRASVAQAYQEFENGVQKPVEPEKICTT
jgi:uncharacterized protein